MTGGCLTDMRGAGGVTRGSVTLRGGLRGRGSAGTGGADTGLGWCCC